MSENQRAAFESYVFLKGYLQNIDYQKSDQTKGIQIPDYEKPIKEGQTVIPLPEPASVKLRNSNVFQCLNNRKSHRRFNDDSITLAELSFLLWATQGIKEKVDDERHKHHAVRKTVPSAGSRHPFETYIAINRIEGLEQGIYRYLASAQSLVMENTHENLSDKIIRGTVGQTFCGKAPVFFLWSVVPYRTIWRYGLPPSVKAITLDGGHIGQNLYIACEALGLGTCMIGAYEQEYMDNLFGLDGIDEFAFYMAPVGKIEG